MLNTCLRIATYIFATTAALMATQAQAVQRTHVSAAFGSDANTATNCTAAAPCRFFQAAMTVTDTTGEVIVLDSGGYGAVTITKSLALIAPTGVYGGISVFPGANGVTIATPGVNVVLRGLSINGQVGNGGTGGILMTAGNRLSIENCVISNLLNFGIRVSGNTVVQVTDTIIRDNTAFGILLENGVTATITRAVVRGASSIGDGIRAQGTASEISTTTVNITDTTLTGNLNGVNVGSNSANAIVRVSLHDNRVVSNSNYGLAASSSLGASVTLSASNNIVSNNGIGIAAFNTSTKVIASGNTVTHNIGAGLSNGGSVFESAGNNTVRGNIPDVSGVITTVGNI